MAWLIYLREPAGLALVIGFLLVADILFWLAGTLLEKNGTALIDRLMSILGSYRALVLMGVVSVAWAIHNLTGHHENTALDDTISIGTMLMDVLVLIGMNYAAIKDRQFRQADRELLNRIWEKLDGR